MLVKNIHGTGERKCKCGSWLAHWEKGSGKTAKYCCVKNCGSSADVGGHVLLGNAGQSHYIVPLCNSHNLENGAVLDVFDGVNPVSANVSETCGR